MNGKRLFQAIEGYEDARRKNRKTQYCQSLLAELGISPKDVESTEVECVIRPEYSEVAVLRSKIVKAVLIRLRNEAYKLARDKGLVEIGKTLPDGCTWNGRVLLNIGKTGLFIVPRQPIHAGRKPGTTTVDPIKSRTFLELLK